MKKKQKEDLEALAEQFAERSAAEVVVRDASSSSSSSSSSTGKVLWRSQMSMTNTGITPVLSDSFMSQAWEHQQQRQGLIKYTQYVDQGCTPSGSSSSGAYERAMTIDDVEAVDFGWLTRPMFVCFSNYTPEGHVGTDIHLGVDNKIVRTVVGGSSNADAKRPMWFPGQATDVDEEHYAEKVEPWGVDADEFTWEQARAEASGGTADECFVIAPGETIGPIVIPPGTQYWAYREANESSSAVVVEDSSSSEVPYGAILLTQAYDM